MKKPVLAMCVALLFQFGSGAAHAQACHEPDFFRFAVIPKLKNQTALRHYETITSALEDELGRRVYLTPVGSYGAVIEGMVDGSIDLAELGPGSFALARDRGADVAAFASLPPKTSAEGPSTYRSVLIVHRDSGIRTFDELRGASLSLVDPASTSGGGSHREPPYPALRE